MTWDLIVGRSFCDHILFGVRDGHAVAASISVALGPRDIIRVSEGAIRLSSEEQSAVELVRLYRVRSVALTHVSDVEHRIPRGGPYNVCPRYWMVIPGSDTAWDTASCDWQENILPFH